MYLDGMLTRRRFIALGMAGAGAALVSCGSGSQEAESAADFSARFARFEPAAEPNGDPAKVVWPEFVTEAGGDVQQLYEFQITNGELMRYMPCFCGCGQDARPRNNRDCYVKRVNADGSVVLDAMAPT